jgi:hypothetical protein
MPANTTESNDTPAATPKNTGSTPLRLEDLPRGQEAERRCDRVQRDVRHRQHPERHREGEVVRAAVLDKVGRVGRFCGRRHCVTARQPGSCAK